MHTPCSPLPARRSGSGLGAAFVLQDLDRSRPVVGLVAFAVGASIAALLIAVFVAVPLLLLRRTRYVTAIVVGDVRRSSSGYAVAWAGEIVANDDWPIEEFANPLRVWPRNFWFVLLAVVRRGRHPRHRAACRQAPARRCVPCPRVGTSRLHT